MVIFKSKQKKFEGDLKIKLCSKRLYPTESVKYVGVKIDTNLSWEYHVNDLSIKLNRANALLFKMREYVSLKILKVVSATFVLVCFSSLNESTCQTRKNVFYFISKILFVLEKIKF